MGNIYNVLVSTLSNFFSWLVTISYNSPIIGIPLFIGSIACFSLLSIFLFNQTRLALKRVLNRIKNFIKHFGEDSLRTKSLKEVKQLTFGKLLYHKYIEQLIIRQIKQIYYPSLVSFLTSLAIISILFLLPWPSLTGDALNTYKESNFYQNYIAIHAGIGAIIFAFLILVAETSNSGKDQDKARLILKETWLFPLATMEILSLIFFTYEIKKYGALFSITLIGGMTIYALYKVIKLYTSRFTLQEKQKEIAKDRFSISLYEDIDNRLVTNTFFNYMKISPYNMDFSYFHRNQSHLYTFVLSKRGVLNDIRLEKLENLLRNLEPVANKIGSTIKKSADKKREAGYVNNKVDPQSNSSFAILDIYVLKRIGDRVTDRSNEILTLPKSLVNDVGFKNKIQRNIDSIFQVRSETTVDKEIRIELDEAKEKAFYSIELSKIATISSVMETYEMLISQTLSVFQNFGGGYSSASAREERHSLFGGWSYIQWIKEDLVDIFSEAVNSEKEKLVKEITYTPIKILNTAFEKKDHFIFQEFLTFQPYLYFLAQKVENSEIKKFLFDRSSRYLKEFCEYKISSELEDYQIETVEINHVKDFVLEIIQTYNSLLKYAFDNRDASNFGSYLSDLHSILHRFKPSADNLRLLEEMKLKAVNISEVEKEVVQNNLNRVTLLEETENEIQQSKDELTFGLAAWCLGKLKESNFEDEDLLRIWNQLFPYLPKEINKLIELLERTTSHKVEKNWGWTWWDLEEKRGDQNGVITGEVTFYAKVCDLFALLLLKMLVGKSVSDIDLNNIEIKRDLSFYLEKDDSFARSSVIQIADKQSEWQKILSEEESKSKTVALTLLSSLVEKQKKEETKILVNTNISPIKVNEFIDNFISAYNKEVSLRNILSSFESVKSVKTISKKKKYWGFNEIQDKEPFLESWHIDYGNFGEHYGRGLAESEDQIIFGELRANSKALGKQNLLSEAILSGIKELESAGYKPTAIFTTFHFGEWRRSTLEDKSFISSWNASDSLFYKWPHFLGLYKHGRRKIPIFRYWVRGSKEVSEVIVSDLRNFIKLNQYPPYSSKSEQSKSTQKEHFLFKITDLSADSEQKTREKLIKDKPSWLEKHKNKANYLKQKVIVHVKEKFELVVKDPKASVKIIITFPKD